MVRAQRSRLVRLTAALAFLLGAICAPLVSAQNVPPADQAAAAELMVVRVEGTVTAGTAEFLKVGLADAVAQQFDGMIILIDTPGGLVDATLEIIKDLLNAPIPIITYVYPRGAIAASAGTFVLLAGHVAAMAPGTTMGAAMPVTMQPAEDGTRTADDKTISFLAGHMTNIAEERGRPTETAERFVTENLTLGATDALEEGMIELIAADIQELLQQLDGRSVRVGRDEVTLATADATLIERHMSLAQRIIHLISDPQVALMLFLIGVYGIFLGVNSPGTFVPETIGAIALILALFGLGMFEVNALGIVLIVMAVILFVVEAFTPTFGFFTAAGTGALIVGALLLPVEPMLPAEWFRVFRVTVFGMAAVSAGFFVLVITKVIMVRRRPSYHQTGGMAGYDGLVTEDLDPVGLVRIRGEWWKARSESGDPIAGSTRVRVTGQDGMTLVVKEASDGSNSGST
ncbi:MAG: nodulation protein NfeD [Spirochaetaceae bacterium]|nr:MAG: nodulation protein NfeD [Spirochaetaceae bacterium]